MLKIINLHSGYGALQVLHSVSLHARPGEIIALIGTNGAGKSTLLKTIAGLITPTEGRVLLQEQAVTGWPAQRLAAAGLTLVPENRGLFPGMSVLDNLRMGGYAQRLPRAPLTQRLTELSRLFPALAERYSLAASQLSGGQQQTLALARALVGAPKILLLDEPTTGLAPILRAEVFAILRHLKETGLTVILAEQRVHEALRIADRAYVLQTGRIVLDGPASVLAASEEIKKAYLGM